MAGSWILTLAAAAAVMLVLSRRAARLFRRQELRVARLIVRLVLVGTACALLIVTVSMFRGLGPLLGLVIGLGLGLLGIFVTRFETEGEAIYYTPNRYFGIAIFSLLIGRIIYRLAALRANLDAAAVTEDTFAARMDALQRSPVTGGLLCVLIGYYLSYWTVLVIRHRQRRA